MQEIDYLGHKIVKWERGSSTFLAWPQVGARLMNWHLSYPDGTIRDIIHWPDQPISLETIAKVRGGNPILFPFCGRTFDRGEIFHWRTPGGERLPMPMHGFAKDGKFELQNLSQNGFSARLVPTAEDQKCYPYSYEFTVSYRFEELALYVEFRLKNLDTKPIPWSAGHHFYFAVPWREGTARSDYRILLPAKEAYRHNPDGSLLPLPEAPQEDTFDSSGLRDRIHCRLRTNQVVFGPDDGEEQIRIRVGTEEKPDPATTVVTWTETDTSPFYCVEPWMGPPNSPEHKLGLHMVKPGKSQTFLVEVLLK